MRLRVEAGRARTRTSSGSSWRHRRPRLGLACSTAATSPLRLRVGQLVLLLVGGVFAAAFMWLAKMTRPASVERFLAMALRSPTGRVLRGPVMILALICGTGVGAGLLLIVRGLYPPRPSLAQALAQLRRLPKPHRSSSPTQTAGSRPGSVARRPTPSLAPGPAGCSRRPSAATWRC